MSQQITISLIIRSNLTEEIIVIYVAYHVRHFLCDLQSMSSGRVDATLACLWS